MNSHLADAAADRRNIAKVPCRRPFDTSSNLCLGTNIPKGIEPALKMPSLPHLDHGNT